MKTKSIRSHVMEVLENGGTLADARKDKAGFSK